MYMYTHHTFSTQNVVYYLRAILIFRVLKGPQGSQPSEREEGKGRGEKGKGWKRRE